MARAEFSFRLFSSAIRNDNSDSRESTGTLEQNLSKLPLPNALRLSDPSPAYIKNLVKQIGTNDIVAELVGVHPKTLARYTSKIQQTAGAPAAPYAVQYCLEVLVEAKLKKQARKKEFN